MSETCSSASLAAGEPIAGTACAATHHWIGLELTRPWREKAPVDNALRPELSAWLRAQAARPDTRPLFIKQRRRRGRALIYANVLAGRVHRFELGDLTQALHLPWDALRAGTTDVGRTQERPIFVCTHSARDHCCGLHGAGVARALCELAPERVWQCTHLGGHRFAATLVALPEGVHYGRVRASDAPALLAALDRGEVHDLDHLRGHVALEPAEQAAVIAQMRASGDLRLDAVRVLSATPRDGATHVELSHRGTLTAQTIARRAIGPTAPPSCSADPAPVKGFLPI